jgi:hypothetical protein
MDGQGGGRKKTTICIPDNFSGQQLEMMFKKAALDAPEMMHKSPAVFLGGILMTYFPCPKVMR